MSRKNEGVMMRGMVFIGFVFSSVLGFSGCSVQEEFPVLTGTYLGQEPPGMTPETFAPGIISTSDGEGCHGFMKNGEMFIFKRTPPNVDWKYQPVSIMEFKNAKWTKPYLETFQGLYPYNFTVAPDGKTLYFSSLRLPDGSGPHRYANIWMVKITAEGWSEPKMFEPPINTELPDAYPTVTTDGTLYFMSDRDGAGGFGEDDIYRSSLENGEYSKVENLGGVINSKYPEVDPFVSPDGSYLIYSSNAPGGYGGFDLYITFRDQHGSWTKPVNMGSGINTAKSEFRPAVTSDGKYFFFTGGDEDADALYWVDAKIIETLIPIELR